MSLIRWSPFLMEDPFEEMDRMMQSVRPSVTMPEVDVYEENGNMIVEMPLAGVDPDKVEISLKDDLLTIKGSMDRKQEVEDKQYFRREVRRGSFQRTIRLPEAGQNEKTSAVSENGLLKISVPKAEPTEAKETKINIQKK